jgi:UDP-N-acetylmuramoylalanine--D-glutamate ligase
MDVAGKKVVVVGLGKSGIAAALFLAEKGARVIANDLQARVSGSLKELEPHKNIELVLGRQDAGLVHGGIDLVVKSPGVPPGIPPLQEAKRLGIPVLTEIEVAYAYIKAPIIGITGTNGKTTTTTLVAEILKRAGQKVHLGGNIGTPLVSLAADCGPRDIVVTELSSFQLENIQEFRPHISAFLNMAVDHLNHHKTFEAYLEAKANIFRNQQPADFAVLNYDDPVVQSLKSKINARVIQFSRRQPLTLGVSIRDDQIVIRENHAHDTVIAVKDLALPGQHNLENALAAVAVTHSAGVSPVVMAEVLAAFPGVEHRMEPVAVIAGVKFVNDSKGTNPDAAIRALESYEEPIVLIAGGKDKGSDFGEFAKTIKARATRAVLLGETREKIGKACSARGFNDYTYVDSLEDAVAQAFKMARPGDLVLLSPACASWDMFTSFEERGSLFKALVSALEGMEADEETGKKRS